MTEPERPTVRNVDYKGAPLDSERGPGLGCFWSQVVTLAILLILTPLSVAWNWPFWLSAGLLFVVLLLLLLAGQTVIFLLRLVAADRRATGRRRPLASRTPTVGELEDRAARTEPQAGSTGPQADGTESQPHGTEPQPHGTEPQADDRGVQE
ncbi:MAG: hypothetical protein ABIV26_03440 [Candidatus Limnocylindrales bacterium]